MRTEARKAYEKKWREEHREQMRVYQQVWRATHRDEVNAKARERNKDRKEYFRQWWLKNREVLKEKRKARYYKNHEAMRVKYREYARDHRVRKYGITIKKYDEMVKQQDNRCAICGLHERRTRKGKRMRLAIDHKAGTKKVRGLLCGDCNTGIGSLRHDVTVLAAAIRYLEGTA